MVKNFASHPKTFEDTISFASVTRACYEILRRYSEGGISILHSDKDDAGKQMDKKLIMHSIKNILQVLVSNASAILKSGSFFRAGFVPPNKAIVASENEAALNSAKILDSISNALLICDRLEASDVKIGDDIKSYVGKLRIQYRKLSALYDPDKVKEYTEKLDVSSMRKGCISGEGVLITNSINPTSAVQQMHLGRRKNAERFMSGTQTYLRAKDKELHKLFMNMIGVGVNNTDEVKN